MSYQRYPDTEGDAESVSGRSEARRGLYRLGSNQSRSSVFEDVEMAHDELYSGPMAESMPTSVSGFAHRRARADSTTSFAFYDDDQDQQTEDSPLLSDEESTHLRYGTDGTDDMRFGEVDYDEDDSTDLEAQAPENGYALRRGSTQSRGSAHHHLIRRDSGLSGGSEFSKARFNQKMYLVNEDLYIVIAAFKTSRLGMAVYVTSCILTCGLAWLLFRWLPKWHVRLIGQESTVKDCDWVVIENSWNEMAILDVKSKPFGRPLSSVFGAPDKATSYLLDDDQDPILPYLRTLDYRYIRLYYHPAREKFQLCNGWKDPSWTNVRKIRGGIDSEEKSHREIVFGNNLIDIEQKSTFQLLVDEVFHPFYVFQIASLILWSLDEYYYYAVAILAMSVGSVVTTLIETKTTMKRLKEISRFECDVRVLRNGFWRYVASGDLVPGDIYEISDPNLGQFPADSILLVGDAIVNESMLTGESVPVSKIPATNESLYDMELAAPTMSADVAKHFLFCGTKIIRARRPQEDRNQEAVALAMVVRTGFNTTKGALVRSMLFPKPSGFSFYADSFRYISVMGVVAILGFVVSLINFIRMGLETHLIITRALDLITIVVPPALPATLTIGISFAVARLKKKQIYCISPQRVNVGGKLDIMCFDKTGTLTEEGLDIFGVRVVDRANNKFGDVLEDPDLFVPDRNHGQDALEQLDTQRAALYTMATCHSLRSVDGELMGDPLDLKMFEFTKWTYEEGNQGGGGNEDEQDQSTLQPSVARPPTDGKGDNPPFELGVIKSFEFVSQLRRASVIVRAFNGKSGSIYVKGAPECMKDICKAESFPSDYDELLSYYTHKGYRVIGCATRHIKKLSWVKAQKMSREEVESDLDFVGFIIFENKLKPTTTAVIDELQKSNIGTVMITGDNILTAISVARECNMINKTAHCFVPHFAEGDFRDPNARLVWESIDDTAYKLDEKSLLPLPAPPEGDASLPYDISNLRNYSIAVSGDVFRWVVEFASPEIMKRMLVAGKVFARMSPDEKQELVEKLQSIDYCAGFCGDGANDCGALKAANVGISLSEAEASVAAPFTSRVFDIRCVPEVIREGRAALVTSFSCFKYMSLYSAIQFTSVSFLYASASNLGDFQFLFIDLALILPIAVFMSWAGPYKDLSRKRPTANLVSRKVLTPLLGHMVICMAIQAVVFVHVRQQSWFIPPIIDHHKSNIKNSENTVLFLVSCFEYIFAGVVLNAGRPFRQKARDNWPFVATISITLLFTLDLVLGPARWVRKLMQLTSISWDFRWELIGLGVLYLVLAWTGENYVFQRLARAIGRVMERFTKTSKKRKEYKLIQERMLF